MPPSKNRRPCLDMGGKLVCKTKKCLASIEHRGRCGDPYTCVFVLCNEVMIEVMVVQKRKKSYNISFKLKAMDSAEKK